jgi:large subunit ribosomal protein L17
MRHRKAGYKLGRTDAHRKATLRNLAASLFEHGQITTTIPRAKALQPFAEKIITLAKRNDLHARRLVAAKLGRNRKAFDWLYLPKDATDDERATVERQAEFAKQFFEIPESDQVERNRYGEIRKAPRLVKHIFDNIAPRYADRNGGYTRIVKLGMRRIGDASELCIIQLVGAEDGPEIGGNLSQRRRTADKRAAYYEQLSKHFANPEPEPEPEPAAVAEAEEAPAAEPEPNEG